MYTHVHAGDPRVPPRVWPLGQNPAGAITTDCEMLQCNEFFQIINFFERSSFKLRCEAVIGVVLCYSHLACCPRIGGFA